MKWRQGVSSTLWLVVFWVAILASRPVSAWLSLGVQTEPTGNEVEGSLDRNVFLALIIAALFVLKKRNVDWPAFVSNNWPLFALYFFFLMSVAWSDYPFIAFKRWLKDFGNIVMVLVILTEKNPIEAVRATFMRCAYVLLPLSILFVKYYTNLGRGYSSFTGKVQYFGVALGKNMLGATTFVLALFALWELIQKFKNRRSIASRQQLFGPLLLLLAAIYLLRIANSATALACMVLGSLALMGLMLPFVRRRLKYLFGYGIAGVLLLVILSTMVDLSGSAAKLLNRDPTLTGRDVIWKTVLAEKSNPLVGTGFNSFWLGDRTEELSRKNNYTFRLNQAHNGYLELYLNGGAIGVCLLLMVLIVAGKRIRQKLIANPDWAQVRLVFWLLVIIYSWSEAIFFRLSPVWFVLLLVVVELPQAARRAAIPGPKLDTRDIDRTKPFIVKSNNPGLVSQFATGLIA